MDRSALLSMSPAMTRQSASANSDEVKLTLYTRHALRVLTHLAAQPDRLASIAEIARIYGISHNHLMKVVNDLRRAAFVAAVRGRSGGIRLARPAREITLGELVQHTESGLRPTASGRHASVRAQAGEQILDEALTSFFATLDGYTVADVAEDNSSAMLHPPDGKSLQ